MAYAYRRAITIDPSKCGSSDSVNFPFYYPGHADLASVANGGYLQNANGYDVGFFADANLSVPLPYERVSRSAGNGLGEYQVKIPLLSSSQPTRFYRAFSDASIATDQSNKTSVWSNVRVYHGGDGSAVNVSDSSSNASNGTVNGSVSAVAGKLSGGALAFPVSGTTGDVSVSATGAGSGFYFSAWFFWQDTAATSAIPLYVGDSGSNGYGWIIGNGSGGSGNYLGVLYGGKAYDATGNSTPLPNNTWTRVATAFDGATIRTYYNGLSVASGVSTPYAPTAGIALNKEDGYHGILDEIRIGSAFGSGNFTDSSELATYNNQSSPSTFYTEGPLEALVAGATTISPVFNRLLIS